MAYEKYQEDLYSEAKHESLDQQLATLTIGDGVSANVTMNSLWNAGISPLPAGEYRILVPDAPHDGRYTSFYREVDPSLKCDRVWFPVEYGNNDRYVHVGNVSHGCVTVLDLATWATIHEALVSHRAPDGRSVGTLIVTGTPERTK